MENATVFLSIKDGGKGIPYGGTGEDRPGGSRNHGFKSLKSNPEEIAAIPEAQRFGALTRALVAMNTADSPFLTVGCEKAFGSNESGQWIRGYLEFAFNYAELIADATFYFKLFFFFNQWYSKRKQLAGVQYNFELEGATFLKTNVSGFTISAWISAGTYPTREGAQASWEDALDVLIEFLSQQPSPPNGHYSKIY